MLANRISWFFDLQPTILTVDTACSSSVVALRLGCQSIRTGDADMVRIPQRVQRDYFYYPAYMQK
jgi:acyl transferase domain-containing protein